MDGEFLSEAIGMIADKFIDEASFIQDDSLFNEGSAKEESEKTEDLFEVNAVPEDKIKKRRVFGIIISAAACAAVAVSAVIMSGNTQPENDYYKNAVTTVTSVTYPVTETSAPENTYTEETKTEVPVSSENTVPVIVTVPETVTAVQIEDVQIHQTFPVQNTEEMRVESVSDIITVTDIQQVTEITDVTEFSETEKEERISFEDFKELTRKGYDLNWSDFEKYKHEEMEADYYLYRYEVETASSMKDLFVSGKSLDEKPEYIFFNTTLHGYDRKMDMRCDTFRELLIGPDLRPGLNDNNKSGALKLGEYALEELHKGNFDTDTIVSYHDASEIMGEEMAELFENIYEEDIYVNCRMYRLFFADEHTVIIELACGFRNMYGYLVTDGSVRYESGSVISKDNYNDWSDDGINIVWAEDNLHYFWCYREWL